MFSILSSNSKADACILGTKINMFQSICSNLQTNTGVLSVMKGLILSIWVIVLIASIENDMFSTH